MVKVQMSEAEIKISVAEFYGALNAMFQGDAAPMIGLWSHKDDVTYLGPQGGILVGWEKVQQSWIEQAALKLGGKVVPQDVHIIVGENLAIVQNYEVGTNYVDGKPQTLKIRSLNIFRKENGKWKMLSHQTDLLTYLQSVPT